MSGLVTYPQIAEQMVALDASMERYANAERLPEAVAYEYAAVNVWRFEPDGQPRNEVARDVITGCKLRLEHPNVHPWLLDHTYAR